MKRVYWRPPGVSRAALLLITVVAVVSMIAVEALPVQTKQAFYTEKIAAARLAREAMARVKSEKTRRGIAIDPVTDPAATGMIGRPFTQVTSNTGYLDAKRTSANPNFAAVIINMLKRAELGKGDVVAVGLSGSFPALNISTFAALKTLEIRPIVITSVAASEWGANDPSFMWPDMERLLMDKHVFEFRSVAASLGGIDDRGFGMSKEGRELIAAALNRNDLLLIESKSVADAIERRMHIYEQHAGARPIKAYVNVGGGSASVGTHIGKKQFTPGINTDLPKAEALMDSVMLRFASRNVPVIHVTQIKQLAKRYGLTVEPESIPRVGEGSIYVKAEYNRWIAAFAIALILGAMLAFIRLDIGYRLLQIRRDPSARPEQMV